MKILLFGKNGQVGWELNRSLQPLGRVIAYGRDVADFSEPDSLRDLVRKAKPDVIVNAAAYTAVDKAESNESAAAIVNSAAPGVLAEEALKINALLVHYSTDYVFDGTKSDPYLETDAPDPVNAYGRTKLAGENAIRSSGCDYLIFRTSWVYASRGQNFLLTVLKLAKERDTLSIVADQVGSPTAARLVADTTILCLKQALINKQSGSFVSDLYHLTASGYTSWHGFSKEVLDVVSGAVGLDFKVKSLNEIATADYPTPAIRPMNSRLSLRKIENDFGITMPSWKDGLKLCVEELK